MRRSWLKGTLGDRLATRWRAAPPGTGGAVDIFGELRRARTILVLPNDRVGGLFIGAPACKAIRQGYPEARVLLVVDPRRASLARQIPFVDGVLTAPLHRPVWSSAFEAYRRAVAAEQADLALCLGTDCSFRLAHAAQVSGARLRVGFRRPGLAAFDVEVACDQVRRYEGDFYFDMLGFLGLQPASEVRWAPAPEVARQLRSRYLEEGAGPARIVGLDLAGTEGHGLSQRQLDDIVGRAVELGTRVLLFFTLAERRLVKYLKETYGKRTILFAQDDLASVAALLDGCRALVSCNTDLLHLAMAMRVPTVGIFDEAPERWLVPGLATARAIRVPRLKDVTIGPVVDALHAALRGDRPDPGARGGR